VQAGRDFLAGEALKQYDERKTAAKTPVASGAAAPAPAAAPGPAGAPDADPAAAGMMSGVTPGASATADEQQKMRPVTAFGRYLKVLFSSNEFVFVS